jgi:hypothetical protein
MLEYCVLRRYCEHNQGHHARGNMVQSEQCKCHEDVVALELGNAADEAYCQMTVVYRAGDELHI